MKIDEAITEIRKTLRPRQEAFNVPTSSGPCSMCAHFTMDGVDAKLRTAGFGRCVLMQGNPVGRAMAMSQAAVCWFEPARFEARSAPAGAEAASVAPPVVVDERPVPAPCDLPEELDFG